MPNPGGSPKTYLLDTSGEYTAWTRSVATNVVASHDTTTTDFDGLSTDGQSKWRLASKNNNRSSYEYIAFNYQTDLNCPAGSTVTDVQVQIGWRCSEMSGACNGDVGAIALYTTADALVATLAGALNFTATSSYAERDTGTISVGSIPANTTHRLRISNRLQTPNTSGAAISLLIDHIRVTVTYVTTHTMSSALTLGGIEAAGSLAFVNQSTFTQSAALTLGGVEAAGVMTFTPAVAPTFNLTAALTLGGIEMAASASFDEVPVPAPTPTTFGLRFPATVPDIQTLLTEAARNGTGYVRLPEGTYDLERPLFIPPCSNLEIEAGGVVLRHRPWYSGVLLAAGRLPKPSADFMALDSNLPNYASRLSIGAITARTQPTFTLDSGSISQGYHVLSDPDEYVVNASGRNDACRELVWVESSGNFGRLPTGYKTGTVGHGRTYGANSFLVPINEFASRALIIRGLELDASTSPEGEVNHLTYLAFVDELSFYDVSARHFIQTGLRTVFCRNIYRENCSVRDVESVVGGEGYSHADYGGYNIKDVNCVYGGSGLAAPNTRHAHYSPQCSEKVQIGIIGVDTLDQVDTPLVEMGGHGIGYGWHGLVSGVDLSGTAQGIGFGSSAHGFGDRNTDLEDFNCNGGDLHFHMDTQDCTATDGENVRRIWLVAAGDRSGLYTGTGIPVGPRIPKNITITNVDHGRILTSSSFEAGIHALEGTITIENCTCTHADEGDGSQYGFLRSTTDCTIEFNGNTVNDGVSNNRHIHITADGADIILNMSGNTINTTNAANTGRAAIRLEVLNGGTITATLTNNTYNRNGSGNLYETVVNGGAPVSAQQLPDISVTESGTIYL